jgi:Fe-S-cluster containining protein
MGIARDLDCRTCGACCCNPDENRREGYADYIEVRPTDRLLRKPALSRRLVVLNAQGVPHLRLDPQGRCVALRGRVGRRVRCAIYDDRPAACRRVEPGDARCLQYRRERGIAVGEPTSSQSGCAPRAPGQNFTATDPERRRRVMS